MSVDCESCTGKHIYGRRLGTHMLALYVVELRPRYEVSGRGGQVVNQAIAS